MVEPGTGVRAVVVLLSVIVVVGAMTGSGFANTPTSMETGSVVAQTDIEPDTILIEITVLEDGSAIWQIHYRTRLDDENTTEAFESLRSDIEDDPSPFLDRFGERMNRTVTNAESATGREMAVDNLSIDVTRTEIPRSYGVVTYGFEWDGFAEVTDDELRAGDAIAGLFLEDGTRLQFHWPDGYRTVSIAPEPTEHRNTTAVWDGPIEFGTDEPAIVLSRADSTVGGDRTDGRWIDTQLAIGILSVLMLLGIAGGLVYRRRRSGVTDEPPVDDDLLSNEEQVLRLLEARGGRMKQKEVAEELDWTAAKTSNVVKGLRQDGAIEGFRLGRENVLRLPEDEE